VGSDVLAQFRREFEERARAADAVARAKDLRRRQLDAESHSRAEEVVRLVEAIGTALTRPPLPYVKFKVLHRFGSQRGMAPVASWSGEFEWTGVGRRRSLRLEVNQGDGMFRWYWSAGDDHQGEEVVMIESVTEDLIKGIVASIADEETFDAGRVPLAPVSRANDDAR
jgi:hypothetical protein